MLVKDFITKEIPVLKSFDTAEYALALMEDFKLKHLPLLSDSAYQCLVSEKDLLALPDPSATIGEPVLFAPAISENGHLHEALAMITRYGLSCCLWFPWTELIWGRLPGIVWWMLYPSYVMRRRLEA